MDGIGKTLIEGIAAVSVIACIAYLILLAKKYVQRKPKQFSEDAFYCCDVTVEYDGCESLMRLYFHKDGLILERDEGRSLCIPATNIIKIIRLPGYDEAMYKVEFDPEVSDRDSLILRCAQDLTDKFMQAVPKDKFDNTGSN